MVRQLEDINSSGELVSIKKGGATPLEEVVTVDDIDQLVPEAPISSISYVRQNQAWVPETVQPNPSDGEIYGRRDNVWEIIDDLGTLWTDHLGVRGMLLLDNASRPEDLGAFLRVGSGGLIEYHQGVDQDTKWTDTSILDISLATVNTAAIVTVTPDQLVTVADGSHAFSCRVDNVAYDGRTLTLDWFVDGTLRASEDVTISSRVIGAIVGFSGGILNDIPSGGVVTAEARASIGGDLTIRGTLFTTTFTITKAFTPAAATALALEIAAERAYVDLRLAEAKVPVFVSPSSFGVTPSKAELNALISGQLDANRTCIVTAGNKVWRVFFDGTDYYYEQLTKSN